MAWFVANLNPYFHQLKPKYFLIAWVDKHAAECLQAYSNKLVNQIQIEAHNFSLNLIPYQLIISSMG